MRRRSPLRKFLTAKLVLLWFAGTVSSFAFSNVPSLYSSFVSRHISHLALVSAVVLPWTISEGAETKTTEEKEIASGRALKVKSTFQSTSSSSRKPKQANLPPKKTTANNALLANIDFLTQLTNNKQASESAMDPLKCFPKALCGLSAESAAITRKRKNGLIQDYIRLMKAVSLNPSVMDNILRNVKEEVASGQVHDDAGSDSEEDEEYEDEDDEEEERKRSTIQKIQRRHIQVSPKKPPKKAKKQPTKKVKKATFRDLIPENSREFTKMYLQERAHVDRLRDDGFNNEDAETTNWWRYEEEKDPSLEDLVDNSGSKLDSQSQEAYYTYGSKRKPVPPSAPIKPDDIPEPKFPFKPTSLSTPVAPPLPKPPRAPVVAVPAQTSYDNSGGSTVGNFFRSMLGFGQASSFKKDPFFEGFKRSMPDGTPTIVTVDKTREILTTAIEIGETLRSPNQCNSLFNGCKYQYIELLHLIDDIRRSLSSKGKNDFITAEFFHGIEEYTKGTQNEGSYGYKTSLSQTSQAETLSQDYKAAASSVAAKTPTGKRKKKKNNSYRNGKMSSMSRESIEIGSDEPTMYGSGQQNYDGYHQKYGHHHHNQPSSQNNFQQNYQYDDSYTRQPKSLWATILSWFGFRR